MEAIEEADALMGRRDTGNSVPEAFIYDAVRTPRGRGKADGALHGVTALQLAVQALQAVRARHDLDLELVEDVILGCVTPIGEQGGVLARTAALVAGYPQTVPGLHINRYCGSGLEAVNLAAAKIASGEAHLVVAGGVESMGRVPMGSDGGALFTDPQAAFASRFVPQGVAADLIASKYGFSRSDLDNYAVESHRRATAAWAEGRFHKSIVPVRDSIGGILLKYDELVRPDASLDGLAKLEPSFKEMGERDPGFDAVAILSHPDVSKVHHVHHAGNSSGIADGAAALLVGNLEVGSQLGRRPRARIRATAAIGSEPTIMLTGPETVTAKVLARAGMSASDIDIWELNEAFASVVLRFIDAAGIDHSAINVNGGAIAMGHPLGATGAIILGTLLDELERQDKQIGLATICIGAGMGVATIIERVA